MSLARTAAAVADLIPLFDAHLDLAWNALSFDRDLTQSVEVVRMAEASMTDGAWRSRMTTTLPELQRAGVRTCVATLLARAGPEPKRSALRRALDYAHPSIAHAHAHGQLAYYRWLERTGRARIVRTKTDLSSVGPLGLILSFEGCDPILDPADVRTWHAAGVRAAGLTHYGIGQYAYGTGTSGGLTDLGHALLRHFESLGIVLDVTHLADEGMEEALDAYGGPVLASHHNCRALVPGQRQLTDSQIRALVARNAVIGTALDAWMLKPGWVRGVTSRDTVTLEAAADHIDHVCQLAGNARQAALGTDLDGGFGNEQTPMGLDRYADVQSLAEFLLQRGYTESEVRAIFHDNWHDFFMRCLPA